VAEGTTIQASSIALVNSTVGIGANSILHLNSSSLSLTNVQFLVTTSSNISVDGACANFSDSVLVANNVDLSLEGKLIPLATASDGCITKFGEARGQSGDCGKLIIDQTIVGNTLSWSFTVDSSTCGLSLSAKIGAGLAGFAALSAIGVVVLVLTNKKLRDKVVPFRDRAKFTTRYQPHATAESAAPNYYRSKSSRGLSGSHSESTSHRNQNDQVPESSIES